MASENDRGNSLLLLVSGAKFGGFGRSSAVLPVDFEHWLFLSLFFR
jgi:hypothetical protein